MDLVDFVHDESDHENKKLSPRNFLIGCALVFGCLNLGEMPRGAATLSDQFDCVDKGIK